MSILSDYNFKYPEGELRRNQYFMDPYHNHQQQTQHLNSELTRNRSALSSLLESFINGRQNYGDGVNGGLGGNEDYMFMRSPSPGMGNLFGNFTPSCDEEKVMKQEEKESLSQLNGYLNCPEMVYGNLDVRNLENGRSAMDGSFGVMNNIKLESKMQVKMGNSGGSHLARQSSSPAGFLHNMVMENGFTVMGDLGGFRNSNTATSEASSLTGGSNGPSSSNSKIMPKIPETERESIPNFSNDSWNKTSFSVLKGAGENNISFSGLDILETQNGNSKNRLTHHLSLPTTFSERATMEKFLHFQGTVPCKIRAKRGFATHPRSIAERVRRTRISERMRKLQDLFPDMDKTNTADMLDMAVAHIKELQKQVKALTDTKAKCSCASKDKKFGKLSPSSA